MAPGVVLGVEFHAVQGGSGLCDSCPAAGGVTRLSFGMPAHRRNPLPPAVWWVGGMPACSAIAAAFRGQRPCSASAPTHRVAPRAQSDVTRKYQFERLCAAHPAALRLPHLPGAGGHRPKARYPGTLLTTLLEGGAVARRRQPTAHRSRTPCYRLPTSMCHVSHDTDIEGSCLMPLDCKEDLGEFPGGLLARPVELQFAEHLNPARRFRARLSGSLEGCPVRLEGRASHGIRDRRSGAPAYAYVT